MAQWTGFFQDNKGHKTARVTPTSKMSAEHVKNAWRKTWFTFKKWEHYADWLERKAYGKPEDSTIREARRARGYAKGLKRRFDMINDEYRKRGFHEVRRFSGYGGTENRDRRVA